MKTKKGKVTKKPKKPLNQAQVRSKAARAHIAEGTRLFALAGRPTKAKFVKVYGPQGPKMTWISEPKRVLMRSTFRRRSRRSPKVSNTGEALGRNG